MCQCLSRSGRFILSEDVRGWNDPNRHCVYRKDIDGQGEVEGHGDGDGDGKGDGDDARDPSRVSVSVSVSFNVLVPTSTIALRPRDCDGFPARVVSQSVAAAAAVSSPMAETERHIQVHCTRTQLRMMLNYRIRELSKRALGRGN